GSYPWRGAATVHEVDHRRRLWNSRDVDWHLVVLLTDRCGVHDQRRIGEGMIRSLFRSRDIAKSSGQLCGAIGMPSDHGNASVGPQLDGGQHCGRRTTAPQQNDTRVYGITAEQRFRRRLESTDIGIVAVQAP